MARVIISAGHTQREPGAVVGDLREVDLTHKIATKVTNKLRSKGIITLSVPPELDLSQRIDWVNKTGYKEETDDICIEIHVNDGGKSGLEGWYKGKGKNRSQELTQTIIETACKKTGLENQGVKSEYDHSLKTLAFLHNTNPVSSLIECLYIDNPSDQEFLRDDTKLNLLAEGIVEGILEFFGIEEISPQTRATDAGTRVSLPRTPSFTPPPPIQSQPFTPYVPPPSPYGRVSGLGTPTSTQLSRGESRKMIQDKYEQILGRKVNEQDLSYFLNLGLSEGQMIKRLIESQEHADLVKESQEYKEMKPKYDKLEIESRELKAQLKDKEELIVQQNELIAQKNKTIQQLQQGTSTGTQPQEVQQPQTAQQGSEGSNFVYPEVKPQKETFVDKVLRRLNNIFD